MSAGLDQRQICKCFNQLFEARFNVRLRGGGAEPDYVPPTSQRRGSIVARADYPASALHEAAHWCVAGAARRALPDYGYVYLPPPRTAADQKRFFASELRNQAVERYLCQAAGVAFRASADDPDLTLADLAAFEAMVCAQTAPPPPRAALLAASLEAARELDPSD